ncbi:Betaine aldehyde dehydrogenase [Phytophthora fragariae]|uniref:Betaine aldehyde dehydrogenase n=1 Tax=Phytophthora fragariae TaxID=53985 RepID=A0A6A3ZEH6_9STRA|nr:Betaine aldehyde dehydrogenase [Phytophthora fragariae]KAE9011372.1 Betaine aldehyde dehydrogenase [Phytophthora fragariae]KAE9113140.1 Betaine aldehyde dehydrogenase [Phytophthora fragariae]KAE9137554.1 Betaine aldehyde dehydrogenase [Phytophthora fragariae]KAE9145165.1 Betaine aldehyde dehydrogenase [Phytophthora fragariae]
MWRLVARPHSSPNARSFPRSVDRWASSAAFDRSEYGLFIDGKFASSSATGEDSRVAVENPATTERLAYVANATAADVDRAVTSGQRAFEGGAWSRASVAHRANVLHDIARALHKRIPEFAEKESLQTGRPIREMRAQLTRIPEWFEYFAALARTSEGSVPPFSGPYVNYVQRLPLGTVGLITPWNHPLLIAVKKLAPALAAGNSVVLKPSELAPLTVVQLAELCHEAGLPAGVFNCVPGLGAVAGQALAEHPSIKKIDFTGGTTTGRRVAAAAGGNLASTTMELGGKAPIVVFDDVNVDEVVNGAAFACFIGSGQTCVTGARLIVHEAIFDELVDKLVAKVRSIRLGDPMNDRTQMGTIISEPHLVRIHAMVERAKQGGATIRCGGRRAPYLKGYFYEPTVITDVAPDMEIVQEEVFGPVVAAYSFKGEDEAVRLANDSPFGLGAAVWTTDIKRAHRVAHNMEAGIIWLNDHHRNDPSSPWGGVKDSGMGRENGLEAYRSYSQVKSVIAGFGNDKFDWFVDDTVRKNRDSTF